jgi:DNA-binding GntR family transcriptional regulator
VSFIPVREALRSLEAEGLLVTRRGRSATVAALDPAELEGICQLRQRIEPELAAQSCRLLSVAALAHLETRIALTESGGGTIDEQLEEYQAIYLELLRPAATGWDARVVQMLCRAAERYVRLGHMAGEAGPAQPSERGPMLRELIGAFRTGDPALARATVADFVTWTARLAGDGLSAAS